MKRYRYVRWLLAVVTALAFTSAVAEGPIQITADEAFDAVATQTDPLYEDVEAVVALVDVRSRAEYYWVGTAARVDEILLTGKKAPRSVVPDLGKVRLIHGGKFLGTPSMTSQIRALISSSCFAARVAAAQSAL